MSRTIEIRGLSDAQCDALAGEAKAAGLKFYDHCRGKLLANTTVAVPQPAYGRGPAMLELPAVRRENAKVAAEVQETDRIGRLEAMMAQMGETLQLLASNPMYLVAEPELPEADNPEVDVDDVIGQSLQAAERQGLTAVEREEPAQAGGVRHIGQRRPAPYSVNAVPQHLRGL
ncbi:hypothetical protein [Bradyrhizobium sp. RT9a]|uniref:hypothetical protein n=1 Tax=Bradyrhizobium sp. RT9a TaxID=3156384 RepID=UPI003395ED4D